MHDAFNVKKNQHWFNITPNLSYFLQSGWSWNLPLKRLPISLRVVPKHPRFATSNDGGDKVRVFSGCSFSSMQKAMQRSFWSLLSSLVTNSAAMRCMLVSSDKIRWHVPYDSPTMLQNVANHSSSVFRDSLSHFCHVFGRGSGLSSSRTLFVIDWHPSFLETLKPFVLLLLAYGIITKCFFLRILCFRSRLADFEAEFDANPLLLDIKLVRPQTALTRRHKNAQKRHTLPYSRTPFGRWFT